MSKFSGADPDSLDDLAGFIGREGSRIGGVESVTNALVNFTYWVGLDAARFADDWRRRMRPQLLAAQTMLEEMDRELRVHANAQRTTSDGSGGATGFVLEAGGDTMVRESPIDTRDGDNRDKMREYRKEMLKRKDDWNEAETKRMGLIDRLLDGSDSHEDWLDYKVLHFDPEGDGKIAVSLGDPSTAKNVAVMVPGVGNEMRGFGGMLGDAYNLKNGREDTAVVAWLGYDTPTGPHYPWEDGARTADGASGLTDIRARESGPKLRSFVNGLNLQDSQTVTVIGHSYGSQVTMFAASDEGLPQVDNIIVMGSPGSGEFDTVESINLAEDQDFYAMRARGDQETHILSNVKGASAPTDDGFGATVLETDAHGDATVDSVKHSMYYTADSGALESLQNVVSPVDKTSEAFDEVPSTHRRHYA